MNSKSNLPRRRAMRLRGYDYSQPGAYFVTTCVQHRKCLFGTIIDGKMRLNEIGQIVVQCWKHIPQHFPSVELGGSVIMPNHFHGIISWGIAETRDPQPFVGARSPRPPENTNNRRGEVPSSVDTNPDRRGKVPSSVDTNPDRRGEVPSSNDTNPDRRGEVPSSVDTNPDRRGKVPSSNDTNPDRRGEVPSSNDTNPDRRGEVPSSNDTNPDRRGEVPSSNDTNPDRRGEVPSSVDTNPDRRGEVPSPSLGKIMAHFKYQSTKHINQHHNTPGTRIWQRNYHDHIIRDDPDLQRLRQYIQDNPMKWELDQLHPDNPSRW